MIKEGEIIFNNRSSLDLNLKLENYPVIPLASEDYEEVEVYMRPDQLIIKNGTYKNKHIKFEFTLLKKDEILIFDDLYEWLLDIQDSRLFYWKTDKCLYVKDVEIGDFEQEFKEFGKITITFITSPFWEDAQETINTLDNNNNSFYYFANAPSYPLVTLYGTGNLQLTINGETMLIKNVTDYVTIDNELMQVRDKNGQSKDFDTTGNFLELNKGKYEISLSSNATKAIFSYKNKWRG